MGIMPYRFSDWAGLTALALLAALAASCRPGLRGRPPETEPDSGWRELVLFGTQTASSTLGGEDYDSDRAPAFSIRNLGDGDPDNCWAEGAPGPGIGQRIYHVLHSRPESLVVVNGWAKSETAFREHGRVKAFRATVLHAMWLEGDYAGAGERVLCSDYREARRLDLADVRGRQAMPLGFDWAGLEVSAQRAARDFEREYGDRIAARARQTGGEGYGRMDVLCLEITEVYPGEKCDDTCVSELEVE